MKPVRNIPVFLSLIALGIGLGLIAFLHDRLECQKTVHLDFGELLWVPDWKIPHVLALGDDDTAADLLWIRSIFYVGAFHDEDHHHGHEHGGHRHSSYGAHNADDHEPEHQDTNAGEDYAKPDSVDFMATDLGAVPAIQRSLQGTVDPTEAIHMYHLFDVITDLDELFLTPYYQGAMYLSLMTGRWQEALKLLEKGSGNRPDSWEIPYYRGFIRLFYQNDKVGAADELLAAALKPGAPGFVVQLAAALQAGIGRLEAAIEFLRSLKEVTEDEELKRQIEETIAIYERRLEKSVVGSQ
jgi:tetratricopeptide (TPR) repeat protein